MDWQERLITLYLWVCKHYQQHLRWVCERHSFHVCLQFSDEEVLTVYLFGVIQQCPTVRRMHTYTRDHFSAWFPHLPSYAGFVQRLGRLAPALQVLLDRLANELPLPNHSTCLLDSMPIILAQGPRRFKAKVALELAGPGYCPSKKLYYHGLKLHCLAQACPGSLPLPQSLAITSAQGHDLTALPELLASPAPTRQIFADKAYQGAETIQEDMIWYTPPKKPKGEEHVDAADKLLATAISRIRQPIESFFNWLQETTGIQLASKVRSTGGLLVHVFGRLCAAFLLLIGWHKLSEEIARA